MTETKKAPEPALCYFHPRLIDFGRLFYPPIVTDCGLYSENGIPHKSTLLLTGGPGSGKTVFALALSRALMMHPGLNPVRKSGTASTATPPRLFLVSLEVFPGRLKTVTNRFGWFSERDIFKESGDCLVHNINVLPEIDRPVPGAEALIGTVFGKLNDSLKTVKDPSQKVIVVIDSITALIRSRHDVDERRRQTHETLYRLDKMFGDRLLLTMLIAETNHESHDHPEDRVEEHLADIVFRLGMKDLPLGRRIRTLEIPKSHGLNMVTGTHSWMIVTDQSCPALIQQQDLRKRIQESATTLGPAPTSLKPKAGEQDDRRWGTIVISPRSRGFLSDKSKQTRPS